MNETALRKFKKKREAYQRYLHTREGTAYMEYYKAWNQAKSCCMKAVREFEKLISNEAKSNPIAFYAYAKSKLKTKSGIGDLEDGDMLSRSSGDQASTLNNFLTLNTFSARGFRKHSSV